MFGPNVDLILSQLRDTDRVLDIGGWACPFNRAQWVMDAEPYETRGYYRTFGGPPSQGGEKEWFSRETWVQRDLCDKSPYPFPDKYFDFVVCSHTLEDLRDPVWVCREMTRIGKRGYVEVPSRVWESTWGVERPHQAGLSHHRWLVEIKGQRITFMYKYAMIHSHWRYALPSSVGKNLPLSSAVQWLWWEGDFRSEERTIHGPDSIAHELEAFVAASRPHSSLCLALDDARRELGQRLRSAARTLVRAGLRWQGVQRGRA